MRTAVDILIADLWLLAAANREAPVSLQSPDGTPRLLDPDFAPYLLRAAIIVPIVEAGHAPP